MSATQVIISILFIILAYISVRLGKWIIIEAKQYKKQITTVLYVTLVLSLLFYNSPLFAILFIMLLGLHVYYTDQVSVYIFLTMLAISITQNNILIYFLMTLATMTKFIQCRKHLDIKQVTYFLFLLLLTIIL